MSKQGLAETPQGTTDAPTMYEEMEQGENVARGCVEVTEVLAYDATKQPRRHPPEKDRVEGEIMKDNDGRTLYVEVPRPRLYCQDSEDVMVFKEKNPKTRIETFNIQLRKSSAIKYIDSHGNMRAFGRKV